MSKQEPCSAESFPIRRKSRTLISAVSPQMPLGGGGQVSTYPPLEQLHRLSVASRLSHLVVVKQASPALPTALRPTSTSVSCMEATCRLMRQIKPELTVLPQTIVPPMSESGLHQARQRTVPQTDQRNQQPENCQMGSRLNRYNQCSNGEKFPKEIHFDPPWTHRISQLQNVVQVLRQYSGIHLKNKNSLIIHCFAQSSAVYMELVFSLINTVIAELGADEPPLEVQPILLDGNKVKCLQPMMVQEFKAYKVQWKNTVLIRVSFKINSSARLFQIIFNGMVPEVFDKISVRTPFAHPDVTRPERDLRHRLQIFCREKNAAARALQMAAKRDGFEWTGVEQYFHNNVQLFKKSYLRTTALKLQPDTEIQHLHSIVTSLKKYSQLYEEKKLAAIIQSFPRPTSMTKEMDLEQLKVAIFRVVHTNEFQKRCPGVQNVEIHRVMRNLDTFLNTNQQKWHPVQRAQPPLVRVRFGSAKAASSFIQLFEKFNALSFEAKHDSKNDGRRNRPFAHKDLTPPELALKYALKEYCRESNRRGNRNNKYVYIRNSKVFEKSKKQ